MRVTRGLGWSGPVCCLYLSVYHHDHKSLVKPHLDIIHTEFRALEKVKISSN